MSIAITWPAGYRARLYNGPDDLPTLAGVLNASEAANGCEYVISPEQLAHDLHTYQRCDLKTDLLIVETVAGPPSSRMLACFGIKSWMGCAAYGIVCHILAERIGRPWPGAPCSTGPKQQHPDHRDRAGLCGTAGLSDLV